MKKIMIFLFLLTSSAFASEITVKVQGMVCSMCAQGLKKKFTALPVVKSIDVSLEEKTVKVLTQEDGDIPDDQIIKIITEAGYNVASIQRK
jgi:copper chaperone CopZ